MATIWRNTHTRRRKTYWPGMENDIRKWVSWYLQNSVVEYTFRFKSRGQRSLLCDYVCRNTVSEPHHLECILAIKGVSVFQLIVLVFLSAPNFNVYLFSLTSQVNPSSRLNIGCFLFTLPPPEVTAKGQLNRTPQGSGCSSVCLKYTSTNKLAWPWFLNLEIVSLFT